jgi:hypothetical protein
MFVPLVLIPFTILSVIFIHPSKKALINYTKNTSELVKTFLYLILGLLLVFVQICTQSLIGLGYFCFSLVIFSIKNHNFDNQKYKILLIIIQIYNLAVITVTYLCMTSLIQSSNLYKYYELIGLDGLVSFISNPYATAHFITGLVIFLYCAFLQTFF